MPGRLAAWVRNRQRLSRERSARRTRAYSRHLQDRMTAAEWADFYREVNVNQVAASAVAEAEADSIHSLARVSRIDGDELNAALVRSLSTLRDQASISADEMAYTSRAFQHLITEDDDGDLYGDGEDGFMDSADEILDEIEMADGTPVNRPARHNYTYQSESMRGRTYLGNHSVQHQLRVRQPGDLGATPGRRRPTRSSRPE